MDNCLRVVRGGSFGGIYFVYLLTTGGFCMIVPLTFCASDRGLMYFSTLYGIKPMKTDAGSVSPSNVTSKASLPLCAYWKGILSVELYESFFVEVIF